MYLLNSPNNLEWTLDVTDAVLLSTDFLVIIEQPDGTTDFYPVDTFIAPTSSTQGLITQTVTPNVEGIWEATLVKGPSETYIPLSKMILSVFNNELIVDPVGVE